MNKIIIPIDAAPISANKFYACMHWTARKKIAGDYHLAIMLTCKQMKLKTIEKPVKLVFGFNNRLDLDNNFIAVKMIIDGLKYAKVLKDDTKKHITEITVKPTHDNYVEIIY